MNRRSAIVGLATLPLFPAAAAAQLVKPYRLSLIGGGRPVAEPRYAVRIDLDAAWKTYWRNPGDSGIPPSFDWSGSENLEAVDVLFPLPVRHRDQSGEIIGYFDTVVFPLRMALGDAARPAVLRLAMFFGVCREVCIPAEARAEIAVGDLAAAAPSERELVMAWTAKVPAPADVARKASIEAAADGPVLSLDLDRPVDDIFVESETGAYFRAPLFTDGNRKAAIGIGNVASPAALAGKDLRLTFDVGGAGLEQGLRLA